MAIEKPVEPKKLWIASRTSKTLDSVYIDNYYADSEEALYDKIYNDIATDWFEEGFIDSLYLDYTSSNALFDSLISHCHFDPNCPSSKDLLNALKGYIEDVEKGSKPLESHAFYIQEIISNHAPSKMVAQCYFDYWDDEEYWNIETHIIEDSESKTSDRVELPEADYVLTDDSAWFSLKGYSVRISASDQGVDADIYAEGYEDRDSLSSTSVLDSDLHDFLKR